MFSIRSLIILIFIFTPMLASATNGYFAHGTGIKNRALAGAGVAFPQDAMASATNLAKQNGAEVIKILRDRDSDVPVVLLANDPNFFIHYV